MPRAWGDVAGDPSKDAAIVLENRSRRSVDDDDFAAGDGESGKIAGVLAKIAVRLPTAFDYDQVTAPAVLGVTGSHGCREKRGVCQWHMTCRARLRWTVDNAACRRSRSGR